MFSFRKEKVNVHISNVYIFVDTFEYLKVCIVFLQIVVSVIFVYHDNALTAKVVISFLSSGCAETFSCRVYF